MANLRTEVLTRVIYTLVYKIKIAANIIMGFKIKCQVGGGGQNFQIYSWWVIFLFFGLKVDAYS